MKVLGIIIFAISILKSFVLSQKNVKIVGGYETSIQNAPYQVAVLYYGYLHCGGSILSCKFILTAGHCTDGFSTNGFSVRSGSSEYAKGGTEHAVRRIDIHPLYDDFLYDYDASILTLRFSISFDSYRQPIQLPFINEAILEGTIVSTSGWGLTQNDDELNSILRMVQLKIFDQVQCFNSYSSDGGVTTRMVCAAAPNKDACAGDSGGPLVDIDTKKLIGIVSFGPYGRCAVDGIPGVYTRVASIRQWIRQIIKF